MLSSSSFGAFLLRADQFSRANTQASPRSSACRNSLKGVPVPQQLTDLVPHCLASSKRRIQSWQYVAASGVIVVAWPIEIGWHQADCIKAVLEGAALAELYSCDLGDGVPGVCGF